MLHYIERIVIWLLVVVLIGMALHTPVTVFIEWQWPQLELLAKSWKEILLGAILLLLVALVWRRGQLKVVLHDKLVLLVAAIAVLHVVLLMAFDNSYVSELAGLLIDLRFYLFFVELYVASRYIPEVRRYGLKAAAVGVGIVMVFGVLQVVALPKDILSHIGYSDATIKPYLTVDLNDDYIRINSTLRGPNPVGAFAIIVLMLIGAWAFRHKQQLAAWRSLVSVVAGTIGSSILLVVSHSRSAWLAAIAATTMMVAGVMPRRAAFCGIVGVAIAGVLAFGLLWSARDVPVVSNIFFHNNPVGGSPEKSDEGHASSLQYGMAATTEAPAGYGIGSTGSASLFSDEPVIVESQYFFMAHESGWFGLGLQVGVFALVLVGLWHRRNDWLSLGLFASGIGLACIGLLLPVWADDTVSLYWWGLAGLALGSSGIIKADARVSHKRTSHQKAARTA